jgi:hypothetical protein
VPHLPHVPTPSLNLPTPSISPPKIPKPRLNQPSLPDNIGAIVKTAIGGGGGT